MTVVAKPNPVVRIEPQLRMRREPLDVVRVHASRVGLLAALTESICALSNEASPRLVAGALAVALLLPRVPAFPQRMQRASIVEVGSPLPRCTHARPRLKRMLATSKSRRPSFGAHAYLDVSALNTTRTPSIGTRRVFPEIPEVFPHPAPEAVLLPRCQLRQVGLRRQP